MSNELRPIDLDTLVTIHGGDAAHDYWGMLKKDWHGMQQRSNDERQALLHGNVGRVVKDQYAGEFDTISMAGDAVSPLAALIGLKV